MVNPPRGRNRDWVLSGWLSTGDGNFALRLRVPSDPEQAIQTLVAADILDNGHLELFMLAADEGGYTPRILAWADSAYREVLIPPEYVVRFEERWGREYRNRLIPGLLGDQAFTLTRETLSPASTTGHGENCDLPKDTLVVIDGRVRVRGPA